MLDFFFLFNYILNILGKSHIYFFIICYIRAVERVRDSDVNQFILYFRHLGSLKHI